MLHAELGVLSEADIGAIFCSVPDLHKAHDLFVSNLEPLIEKWKDDTQVAEHIKLLVSYY